MISSQLLDKSSKEGVLNTSAWFAWETEESDSGWLLTYVDVLSVILAMLVVLLGQMAVQHLQTTDDENATAAYEAVADKGIPNNANDEATNKGRTEIGQPQLLMEEDENRQPSIQLDQTPMETTDAETRLIAAIEDRFQGEVKVVQRDKGISLEIADVILFDSAKAELLPKAFHVLQRLAVTLQEIGEADIAVEGHTDDRPILGGRFRSNWELAAARANAVTHFLLDQGFSPKHLRSISYADAHPVADNSNPHGRAENRRVNLRVEFLD